MKARLLHHAPLSLAVTAIRRCYLSEGKSDSIHHSEAYFELGRKDRALIERVIRDGHTSTLETLNYCFDIDGLSRAALQELARHRHASLSVQSTRYAIFQGDDMMNCPKCGSENVSIERRIDGMKTCLDCGYKWRNVAQAVYVVITSCHEERKNRDCLCCVCGKIHKCTPSFDFYTTDDHGEGLVCERCFHEYLGNRLNAIYDEPEW